MDEAPAPARFARAIPLHFYAASDAAAPEEWVHARLCGGDAEARQAHLAAIRSHVSHRRLEPRDEMGILDMYDACLGEESLCRWLASVLSSDEPLAVRRALWRTFAYCEAVEHRELALHADAPDEAVVGWLSNLSGYLEPEPGAPPERVLAAIEGIARTAKSATESTLIDAARALGHFGGGDPRPLLTLLIADVSPELAARLRAAALGDRPEPWAKAMLAEACTNEAIADTGYCRPELAEIPERLPDTAYRNWRSRKRPADLVERLARCVATPPVEVEEDPFHARRECLARLSELDLPRAQQVIVPFVEGSQYFARAQRFLQRAIGIESELVDAGVLTKDRHAEHGDPPLSVAELLVSHGRARAVDVWVGDPPYELDIRLTELAMLAGPELEGVAFEENGRELRAYRGGRRWTTQAIVDDPRVDPRPLVGLLNVVLRDGGSTLRYVELGTATTEGEVLVGIAPAEGWKRMRAAGLDEL